MKRLRANHHEAMDSGAVTLQIKLEHVGGSSWWAGVIATLTSQSGNVYMRFVGRINGDRRIQGIYIPSPRTLGTLPPQEEWAPGMTQSLEELCR
jgi:hypothetical protein